jgi:hypothetical protein
LTPECQQLLQSLETATAGLAGLDRDDMDQVQRALTERGLAIDAIQGWIASEQQALRPVTPETAEHLTRDLETGAEFLVRLALDRDATRIDLMALDRDLQVLRGLGGASPAGPTVIDCRG